MAVEVVPIEYERGVWKEWAWLVVVGALLSLASAWSIGANDV